MLNPSLGWLRDLITDGVAMLFQNFHYMIQVIEYSITNDLYLDLHEGNYWCRAREAPHIRARALRTRYSYIVRQPSRLFSMK
jgi:hypothetical protein